MATISAEHADVSRKPRAAISWSGGKASGAALGRARESFDVVAMVTMFDEEAARSRSHGLRPEVLASDGIAHVIFGDILFDEHRRWAEGMCAPHGITAVEPLWGSSTEALFEDWIASGADAVIVTALAEFLGQTWLGRRLDRDLLPEFARLGVDPCGERGEYHTGGMNTPLFDRPLHLRS